MVSRGIPIRSIIATAPIYDETPTTDIYIGGDLPIVVDYWSFTACGEYFRSKLEYRIRGYRNM